MSYLIDGHNLIPKLGLRLDSLNDEMDLVTRLQEYCRLRRVQVEVYFDGAPPGQVSTRKMGSVTAHFIQQASSADAAIESRLTKLGRAAKNWTVVSSDNRIQRAAGAVHARVLSSEGFSQEMLNASSADRTSPRDGTQLSPGEVEEWLKFFDKRGR
jgi:predicted RNA-binding protein with PIN domain